MAYSESDEICKKFQITHTYMAKKKNENSEYCINFKKNILFNKKCRNQLCLESMEYDKKSLKEGYMPNFGTLGFHYCQKLFGTAQVIKVKMSKGKWRTFDRCILKNGGVIDTVSLLTWIERKNQDKVIQKIPTH
ncbi:MAG: hypothetical protein HOE90_18330 [Bacteriovoracaceae bacterium]|jgi:hypothetical protein|nr:hypothetical protein [Bacteriovoracaceae bacterium]